MENLGVHLCDRSSGRLFIRPSRHRTSARRGYRGGFVRLIEKARDGRGQGRGVVRRYEDHLIGTQERGQPTDGSGDDRSAGRQRFMDGEGAALPSTGHDDEIRGAEQLGDARPVRDVTEPTDVEVLSRRCAGKAVAVRSVARDDDQRLRRTFPPPGGGLDQEIETFLSVQSAEGEQHGPVAGVQLGTQVVAGAGRRRQWRRTDRVQSYVATAEATDPVGEVGRHNQVDGGGLRQPCLQPPLHAQPPLRVHRDVVPGDEQWRASLAGRPAYRRRCHQTCAYPVRVHERRTGQLVTQLPGGTPCRHGGHAHSYVERSKRRADLAESEGLFRGDGAVYDDARVARHQVDDERADMPTHSPEARAKDEVDATCG